jgi:HEAT repeat protein
MKNDPILAALDRLTGADAATAAKALESKSNLVAAKAAKILGESLERGYVPHLIKAFHRFLDKGDKGCAALTAIARSLVTLDCDDADLFRKGIRHIQMEGSWGPSVDVAAELRSVCAIGLANTRDLNKMRELVTLLADREYTARGGAARALATVGSEAAAAVLRFKVLTGDEEPEVFCDCLHALIAIEGADALPLAERYLNSLDEAIREAAIHALGESRRDDAIAMLIALYERTANPETKNAILLVLRASRTEAGMKFVTAVSVTSGESGSLPE